jgi:two-component system probable response regulator PhcQ
MLVDDEESILKSLNRTILHSMPDCEIEYYTNPIVALKRAEITPFELFMSDFRMPNMTGVEFLTAIKDIQPESIRIILSGYNDINACKDGINNAQIYRFLSKPWQNDELILTIEQALNYRSMIVENRILADEVRAQRAQLHMRNTIIEKACLLHPELFKVDRDESGAIIIHDHMLEYKRPD